MALSPLSDSDRVTSLLLPLKRSIVQTGEMPAFSSRSAVPTLRWAKNSSFLCRPCLYSVL